MLSLRNLIAVAWLVIVPISSPAFAQNFQNNCGAGSVSEMLGPSAQFTRDPRWSELSYDPAHRGVTHNSEEEAMLGLALERAGRIPAPIVRDASGRAEFIDAKGVRWDVKAFRSFTPSGEKMDIQKAVEKVDGEFLSGENVILDTRRLTPEDLNVLKFHIGITHNQKRVLWYP